MSVCFHPQLPSAPTSSTPLPLRPPHSLAHPHHSPSVNEHHSPFPVAPLVRQRSFLVVRQSVAQTWLRARSGYFCATSRPQGRLLTVARATRSISHRRYACILSPSAMSQVALQTGQHSLRFQICSTPRRNIASAPWSKTPSRDFYAPR